MPSPQLLAIVEVPHNDRVRCQADGCNHSVFRRIHVVRDESGFHVYGSECFKKIFAGGPPASSTPAYTTASGRALTEEERQLLIANTERLILQLEAEFQVEVAKKSALAMDSTQSAPRALPAITPRQAWSAGAATANLSIEKRAKEMVQSKYGVNPDLPGWHGLVLAEMKRIRDEMSGAS